MLQDKKSITLKSKGNKHCWEKNKAENGKANRDPRNSSSFFTDYSNAQKNINKPHLENRFEHTRCKLEKKT